ncbi:WD40 repeat-like protein [Xylariaceae sp. FL0594]|nr:WD40 repeat-like protein [Xylariaceae sp. FL0594]
MSDKPAPRLRRDHVLNPITALAFLSLDGADADGGGEKRQRKKYLLAAEDTDVKIYDVESESESGSGSGTSRLLCGTLRIFTAQQIHGIVVGENSSRVLVWGGNAVKVLSTRVIEDVLRSDGIGDGESAAAVAVAPDWIFDARMSPFDDDHFVLLTAHNEVIRGSVSEDGNTLVLGQIRSPSRPILYSGNFFWVSRDCVLVAAGTVFGEIVVWKCWVDSDHAAAGPGPGAVQVSASPESRGCEVLFVFSGHEGSIFGVHISPEIRTSSDETIRLLASCSDDRTIRIWDITERAAESEKEAKGFEMSQISDARQTGFGDSITRSIGLANNSSRCVAMAMGHVSRIWQVEIQTRGLLSSADEVIEVYSFGEDATMQRWHLKLDGLTATRKEVEGGSSMAQLVHYETFSNHSGKQIWSHAMVAHPDGLVIATGGGDGKIAVMKHDTALPSAGSKSVTDNGSSRPRSIQEETVSPEALVENCKLQSLGVSQVASSFKHGNGKETFQSFAFLSDDRLIVTTRSGRVFLGVFGNSIGWTELEIPDTIRKTIQSYTILRCSRTAPFAFIGATNGEVFLYHDGTIRSVHKAPRKITEIVCLSDTLHPSQSDGATEGHIQLLITVFGSNKAEIVTFDDASCSSVQRLEIVLPDDFIATTAAWCHGHLIIGSRSGSISFLRQTDNGDLASSLTAQVTIGDKITSILPLPRRSEHPPAYFVTTSRDGKYRIYEIWNHDSQDINNNNKPQILLVHETKPPFGPLIEGAWLFETRKQRQPQSQSSNEQAKEQRQSHDLMLCGFRSRFFVIWNATRQEEVATIDCGGGHRVFDYAQIRDNPAGFRFACTKASQMKTYSQTRGPPHRALKKGGHGREIKALAMADSGRYAATGAEDTMVRIWGFGSGDQKGIGGEGEGPRCILTLEKHNTGIQKLKWCGDDRLFSSGGNEELFAWRVTALERGGGGVSPLGVVCEGVFGDISDVGDLRIMDFDVWRIGSGSDTEEEGEKEEFLVSMALSNSTVQSYVYSARDGTFRLLDRRTYTGACLTQLRILGFGSTTTSAWSGSRFAHDVLVAATDGHLAVFSDLGSSSCPSLGEDDGGNGIKSKDRKLQQQQQQPLVTKLHQSTIKSLDVRRVSTTTTTTTTTCVDRKCRAGTSYLVVTGGDDDAIGFVCLFRRPDLPVSSPSTTKAKYEIRNKSIVRSAHAAAVTGIGIVGEKEKEEGAVLLLVSTGNDQRVKVWRILDWFGSCSSSPPGSSTITTTHRRQRTRVQLLGDAYSGVADAGDLEVSRNEKGSTEIGEGEGGKKVKVKVLVAGVGIEVWDVDADVDVA